MRIDATLAMWIIGLDFDFQITIWPRRKCVGCEEICPYTSLLEFDFSETRQLTGTWHGFTILLFRGNQPLRTMQYHLRLNSVFGHEPSAARV